MDLGRMLDNCRRDQWRVSDLDWSAPPRRLSRDDEEAIVQLFTDMAGIERLAAALFREQGRRATDPTLRAIFATFVADELRHAETAERLAAHYDVHRYRAYAQNPSLRAFAPVFLDAISDLSDDVANAYITSGELILDVALLRSIDDYVADDMSRAAMRLINRDESRHIAIDYHMSEYYCSEAYQRRRRERPRPPLRQRARSLRTFARMLYLAQPFIREVFFLPMARVDPSGLRLRQAFKRMQYLGRRPEAARLPFARFLQALQDIADHRLLGPLLGGLAARISGVDQAVLRRLYSEEELRRAAAMSYDELADEALGAKQVD